MMKKYKYFASFRLKFLFQCILYSVWLLSFYRSAAQTQTGLIQYGASTTELSSTDFQTYQKHINAPIVQDYTLIQLGDLTQLQVDGKIVFNLPGYADPIKMKAERVEFTDGQHYVWQGVQIVQDSIVLPGHILLIRDGDQFVGEIAIDYDFFLISSVSNTHQVLIRTKDLAPKPDGYPEAQAESSVCVLGNEQCFLDVAIIYTPECLTNYPNIAMLGRLCFEQMNAAMLRSQIKHRGRLVGVLQWNGGTWINEDADKEGATLKQALEDPISWVTQIKYALDADLVILMTSGIAHVTAIGYANRIPANSFETGSAVVNVNYALTGAYVYSHEAGHLLGGHHEDDSDDLPARAHEFDATFGSTTYHYLTIMHNDTDQILNYSNPNVNYLGVPTGTSDRFNVCRMQEYGCSVSQILPADECRVRTIVTANKCNNITITASLKKDDGSTCADGVYWEFAYSYDGVTYVTGALTSNPMATIPYSVDGCKQTVFVRIRSYDINLSPINLKFDWFDRPCICKKVDEKGAEIDNFAVEMPEVFPNPSQAELLFDLRHTRFSEQDGLVMVRIIDVEGTLLKQYNMNLAEGVLSVDITSLPIGTYFIHAEQGGQTTTKKFIKQ